MVGEGTCDNFPVKLRLDLVGRLLQRLMAPISFPINLLLVRHSEVCTTVDEVYKCYC